MLRCIFCSPKPLPLAENENAFSIYDKHPVALGHCLIIPRMHVPSIFDLPRADYIGCFELLREVKKQVKDQHNPQGFNVGINCGSAAGQTVDHAHIHLIPRYRGDVPNPRGGVRNVIPGKGDY